MASEVATSLLRHTLNIASPSADELAKLTRSEQRRQWFVGIGIGDGGGGRIGAV